MSTFCLVHGAWHGAWCWDRLIPELSARGHRAIAVELPCADIAAGITRYAEVVLADLAGAGDDVVLVGHSLAGLALPLVAAQRPLRRLIFLSAFIPQPGMAMLDQLRADRSIFRPGFSAAQTRHDDGTTSWPPDAAIATFYHDCAPEDAAWAAARLRRQAGAPLLEPAPRAPWPRVACSYIVCADDRAIAPEWSRRAARERLGVEPIELPGGHSPFIARPAALAAVLSALCTLPAT